LITLWLFMTGKMSLAQSIRNGFFTAVSTITTTGFTTSSYESWGYFPQMVLLFTALIGGCSGSTTGGIKIFRVQILIKLAQAHLQSIRRPHGLFVPSFEGHKINSFLATSVFTFLMLYVTVLIILSCLLSIIGWDMMTSVSGAVAFLGNVGVGVGKIIGPSATFAQISDSAKYILMLGMILGRLEILTILILFMPSFWKN
jgi:trk system potassium uptake protein TrkH